MSGRKHKPTGTLICDPEGNTFYGVITVFGTPLLMHTKHAGEAVLYSERELPEAVKALNKSGVTSIRKVSISATNMHVIVDWQP